MESLQISRRSVNKIKVSRDIFSFPMKTQISIFSVFRVVQGEAKTPKKWGVAGQILHFYMP